MPQLNFYVPKDVADRLRRCAEQAGKPLSKYLAQLVEKETDLGWPEGYFERVIGSWKGPLERPEDPPPQEREEL